MPLLAETANGQQLAQPGMTGHCPGCKAPMIPKCGRIVTWHWAHTACDACDPWRTGETEWHLEWKERLRAAGAQIEVPIKHDGVMHIADAISPRGTIIELAATYHSGQDIAAREAFYGRMVWIYNADRFMDRVDQTTRQDGTVKFRWKHPATSSILHRRPVYWHSQDRDEISRVAWIKQYRHMTSSFVYVKRTYGGLRGWEPADDFLARLAT